jgi:hypothetical protein
MKVKFTTCKRFISETLTERQVALEERKFCLITCEVAYNTELVELIGLSKQSVGCADHLPKFNRRAAVTAIERGMLETHYTSVLVCRFCFIKIMYKFYTLRYKSEGPGIDSRCHRGFFRGI